MKEEKLYTIIEDYTALESPIPELLGSSIKACLNAYAPYSKFRVGAAVLLDNNQVVLGGNHENASYPLCMCAERVALFSAFSQKPSSTIKALAIHAMDSKKPTAVPPCGACRQVIREFELKQPDLIPIYLVLNEQLSWKFDTIQDLLPLSFDPSFLP